MCLKEEDRIVSDNTDVTNANILNKHVSDSVRSLAKVRGSS